MRFKYSRQLFIIALSILFISLTPFSSQAQNTSQPPVQAYCTALIQRVVYELYNNCAALPQNYACYGFNKLAATFTDPQLSSLFSRPADRMALGALQSLQSAPADPAQGQWGIGVLHLQANLPTSPPNQSALGLMLGEVRVTNGVSPDEQQQSVVPVKVITKIQANLHIQPDLASNTVGALPPGFVLEATATTADHVWIRVNSAGPAWVRLEVLDVPAQIDTLPVIAPQTRAPMQSFFVQTGINPSPCADLPSVMGLQSLNGVPADLTINGAPVRLGPAATLVTLQSQSKTRLDMTVQSGSLEIADGRLVNEGQTLSVVLDNDSGGIINWADAARPATPHELTLGIIVREVIKSLSAPIIISPNPPPPPDNGNINPAPPPAITPAPDSQGSSGDSSAVVTNSGNSQVDITINGGQSVVVTTPVPQSPSQPSYKPPSSGYNYQSCRGASVNYIVQPGDTLFRIAMMYGSTIEAIAAANRIYNPNLIFAGQLLVVPCAGSYTYPGNNSYPSGYGYPYPPNSPGYPGGPMPCYSATGKSLQFSFPGIC